VRNRTKPLPPAGSGSPEPPLHDDRTVGGRLGGDVGRQARVGGIRHEREPGGQGVDEYDVGQGAIAELRRKIVKSSSSPTRAVSLPAFLQSVSSGPARLLEAERGRTRDGQP